MNPETLRYLADAVAALRAAFEGEENGLVCDHIEAAQDEIKKAIVQMAAGPLL